MIQWKSLCFVYIKRWSNTFLLIDYLQQHRLESGKRQSSSKEKKVCATISMRGVASLMKAWFFFLLGGWTPEKAFFWLVNRLKHKKHDNGL